MSKEKYEKQRCFYLKGFFVFSFSTVRYGRQTKRMRNNVTIQMEDDSNVDQWKDFKKDLQTQLIPTTKATPELTLQISQAYALYCTADKTLLIAKPFHFVRNFFTYTLQTSLIF